jgi:hypothetical protein
MLLRPFLNGATSCASYLFGCGTHAELAVVDPHAEDAGPTGGGRRSDGLLFPYPGTDRLWTESEYRNWREDYFVPIARGHGLGSESDDPYALRHIYATLRIAGVRSCLRLLGCTSGAPRSSSESVCCSFPSAASSPVCKRSFSAVSVSSESTRPGSRRVHSCSWSWRSAQR